MYLGNKIAGVLVMVIALQACASVRTQSNHHKDQVYTLEHQCDQSLNIRVGEKIKFSAPENTSTDYQWQLKQPLKLFILETSTEQEKTQYPVVGAGGIKHFSFTAQKAGVEQIDLRYVRPWQPEQIEQQWQCTIKIVD